MLSRLGAKSCQILSLALRHSSWPNSKIFHLSTVISVAINPNQSKINFAINYEGNLYNIFKRLVLASEVSIVLYVHLTRNYTRLRITRYVHLKVDWEQQGNILFQFHSVSFTFCFFQTEWKCAINGKIKRIVQKRCTSLRIFFFWDVLLVITFQRSYFSLAITDTSGREKESHE